MLGNATMVRTTTAAFVALIVIAALSIGVARDSADARPLGESPVSGQPQGLGPNPKYDWNHDQCSDLFDLNNLGERFSLLKRNCPLGSFDAPVDVGNVHQDADAYVMVGDWDRDDCGDMVTREGDSLAISLYDCATHENNVYSLLPQFASTFDWIVGPGSWDSGACPDLITRDGSNGNLLLFYGDCEHGLSEGAGHIIGSGWGIFNWISGPGDWDGDGCSDLLARRADTGDLWLYPGDCEFSFKDNARIIGGGWNGFDWILAGGNWDQGADNCPDILVRKSDNLYAYGGNCEGEFNEFDHVFIYNIGFHTILPGDASGPLSLTSHLKGDINCDRLINTLDVSTLLSDIIGGLKHSGTQTNCNTERNLDCQDDTDTTDALELLYDVGGLLWPFEVPLDCPAIGAPI